MPPVEAIGSSMVNHNEASRAVDWQVFSAQAASSKFGPYGGRCAPIMTSENVYQLTFVFSCRHNSMHGVTFLSYDGPSATDSHTLLSLQRLYSTLNISSPQSLSPPHRVIFPAVRTFVDHSEDPLALDETAPRHLSSIGLAPETLKAAYPSLAGPLFTGDFDDFNELGPVVLDRLVVADRGAARRAGLAQDVPAWAPPFSALRTSEEWFEPVRGALAAYFGAAEDAGAAARTRVVTYLARQDGLDGERLRAADHTALLDALAGLSRKGVTVHIVDESATWTERMRAVAQSTVSRDARIALSAR